MEKSRLNIEIDAQLHDRVRNALPWGLRAATLRTIIEMLVILIERHGLGVVELLLDGQLTLCSKGDIDGAKRP